jgi:hypothetical protein
MDSKSMPEMETALVANARMYAVNATVADLWARLFAWLAAEADVPLTVIAHPPPQPLRTLWQRPDIGCVFICGYPFSTWQPGAGERPQLLAAPQPSAVRYGGAAVYCTDIVVRRDSQYIDAKPLRGVRFAYTTEESQSGWQAPRRFFAERALAAGGRFFGAAVGPLYTPRAVVDAVIDGRVDAAPLDSWWHDLLRRHEPETAAGLRTIACTPLTPIPPLVSAVTTPAAIVARLTAALGRVAADPALAELRDALCLRGFARVTADDYAVLARQAAETDALGYPRLQ